MSDFTGINLFKALVTESGVKLNYEDFDKDQNGEITQEEYDAVLKEVKLDSVEFSSLDNDGDKVISEDEFMSYEQKILMQDAVNEFKSQISKDFSGDMSKYITDILDDLKMFLEEFAKNYDKDISKMAENFKKVLPEKYEEFKEQCFNNDPNNVKSEVLDEIIEGLALEKSQKKRIFSIQENRNLYSQEDLQAIGKKLESITDDFIKSYEGDNLKEDLRAYLNDCMQASDAEKMEGATQEYRNIFASFGTYVDSNEFSKLKEKAEEFIKIAIQNGISVNIAGNEIKNEANIKSTLNKFDDAQALNDAIEEFISNLSTLNLLETTKNEVEIKAQEEKDEEFRNLAGEEYAINPNTIDYSCIDGYFENSEVCPRSIAIIPAKWREQQVFKVASEYLTNDSLKYQIKSEIKELINSKGIGWSKIDSLFENVYDASVDQAIGASISYDGSWAESFKVKDLVDKFIEIFNTNIATAVNEMNSSDKDLDFQDLDYFAMNNNMPDNLDITKSSIVTGYKSGSIIVSSEYLESALEGLKAQVLQKANAMCLANGVEFDLGIFSSIFNNAKLKAVSEASSSNPLVSIFTNTFKENYTAWVEDQK